MSYTLLQLVDQVSGELGLQQPTAVIGNTNNQAVQMLALAQRLGKDLVTMYEWNRLNKVKFLTTTTATTTTGTTTNASATVTSIPSTSALSAGMVVTGTGIVAYCEIASVDSSTQVTLTQPATASGTGVSLTFAVQDYALPTDYDRMVPDTNWDRTDHWRNLGPKTPQEWQWLQGGIISTGPRERYRIIGNKLRIFAALTTPYNFAYEYISNYWVLGAADSTPTKSAYTVDTDTCVFPDALMLAGLKLYFRKAKRLDYAIDLSDFTDQLSQAKAADNPQPIRSLAPIPVEQFIGPWSIQDGNWPTS